MKERCHICGRKNKEGSTKCKICSANDAEELKVGYHATHNVSKLVNPLVNLLLTNERLLVFEDMTSAGSMGAAGAGGGLLGYALGKAADKAINSSLGRNGSMKKSIPLMSIESIDVTETKKGIQITLNIDNDKPQSFTLGVSFTDPSLSDFDYIEILNTAIEK